MRRLWHDMFGHPEQALQRKFLGLTYATAVPYAERCLSCQGAWWYTLTMSKAEAVASALWDDRPTERQKAYRERQRG